MFSNCKNCKCKIWWITVCRDLFWQALNISGGPLWVVIPAVNKGVRFPKLRCSAQARWAQVSTQMQVIRWNLGFAVIFSHQYPEHRLFYLLRWLSRGRGGHFDDAKIQPNVSSIPHHPPHKSLAQACTGSARHLPPPRSWVAQRAKNALGQVGQVNFEHGRQWQSILASW